MKSVAPSLIFGRRVTSLVCGHEMPLSVMPTSKSGYFHIRSFANYVFIMIELLLVLLHTTVAEKCPN